MNLSGDVTIQAPRKKVWDFMTDPNQEQARQILDTLASIPFEQCQPISRNFTNIPPRPGLYAIRHRTEGLLYIGKTKSLRGRFSKWSQSLPMGMARSIQ